MSDLKDNENKEKINNLKNSYDSKELNTVISVKNKEKNEEPQTKESSQIKDSQFQKSIIGLSRIKSLKKTMINSQYIFLNYLGDPDDAEIHRDANVPLKKVGEFNEKTVFCQCCDLPKEQKGVMEKYKYSESTDEFIQNGQAISLYFSFYIYSIFILIIAFLSISLPCLIISYSRTDELNKICNKIYENIKIEECKIYLDNAHNIEDENKNSFNFILDYSGLNIKNYRIIHEILTENDDNNLEDIFVNYSVLNFIGIWTILLIYFGYTILINNKDYLPDIDLFSPKNYSIMITGMDGFFTYLRTKTNYMSIIKEPENKENSTNDKKDSSEREYKDEKSNAGVDKFESLFQEKLSEIFLDDKKKYDIKKVNFCFKINKYIELEEKLEKCTEITSLINSPYQKQKNLGIKKKSDRLYYYSPLSDFNIHICERTKKLSDIIDEKKEVEKQINQLLEEAKEINMEKFAGAVIISFNTIKEKEEFMSHIPNSLFIKLLKIIGKLRYFFCFCCIDKIDNSKFGMKNLKINIEEAPSPEDIIFENLEFTQQSKVYRVVGINMISILLIAIGFAIILGFQQLQIIANRKNYNRIIYYIISLCITIVTSIINIIFEEILDMLTKHEKQNSITNYYLSYSIKLSVFSFLVKGIIPLVVEEILGTSNYEILITNMLTMFLVNSIITPLIWTFNVTPVFWIKKLEIYLIRKNRDKYLNMNQKKLNELYENSDMKIAEKYSYIAKTLLMTFLYISIFPFGVLISLGGFIFCFLLEKYNFINNYKRPEILNNTLFYFYLENFIIIIFFIGIGDYVFLKDVFSSRAWSLVNIIFLGILIVIPYNYFLNQDFIGFKESNINKITYDEAYFEFLIDYDRINPMARDEGRKNFIEKLYEKKLIDEEEKNRLIKDFSKINLMNIYYQNRNKRNNFKLQKTIAVENIHKSISKSFLPNQKNMFKLSSIYTSFVGNKKDKQNKTKTHINQSQMINPLFSKNKLKDKNLLLINDEQDKSEEKKTNKIDKKKNEGLNEIEEIKEEDSIQEDEKESEGKIVKFNLDNKKDKDKEKEQERKSDKPILKRTFGLGKNVRDFYSNSIMFRICGSMQVFNYVNREKDENEDDEDDFLKDEEEVEEEEVKYENKNKDRENLEVFKSDDNKKE